MTYLFRHIINAEVVGSTGFDLDVFGRFAIEVGDLSGVDARAAELDWAAICTDPPLAFPPV